MFFYSAFRFFDKRRDAVNGTEVYKHDRDDGEHIPERMRDPLVEKIEQRVVGHHRIHIVDVNDVARRVDNIVILAVPVDRQIGKVNGGVDCRGDANGGADAFCVKLAKPKLEKQYWYARFKNVRKIIEAENVPADLCMCYRMVEYQRHGSAERPKKGQISNNLVAREYRKGQYHRVEGAKVEREILKC